jgi:hypothetical protein
MLNLCGIVVAILKMAIGRKFWMSGINLGHHNLPAYEISLKSDSRKVPWMVLYKVTVFRSSWIFNMAARANNML